MLLAELSNNIFEEKNDLFFLKIIDWNEFIQKHVWNNFYIVVAVDERMIDFVNELNCWVSRPNG